MQKLTLFVCVLGLLGFQHKVRLGKYKRDSDSLTSEGENLQAVWSPDAKLIAVLVSASLPFHIVISLIIYVPMLLK